LVAAKRKQSASPSVPMMPLKASEDSPVVALSGASLGSTSRRFPSGVIRNGIGVGQMPPPSLASSGRT
jgi:hypothetical protein